MQNDAEDDAVVAIQIWLDVEETNERCNDLNWILWARRTEIN